jgi:hypothetical protein
MHFIIREDYWRPLRAASNYFFLKKKRTDKHANKQTYTQTHTGLQDGYWARFFNSNVFSHN